MSETETTAHVKETKPAPKKGIKIVRAVLKNATECPMLGVEANLYASKGVEMYFEPMGLVCTYKGKGFIIPAGNIGNLWT